MGSPAAADSAWRDDAACIGADPRVFTDPRPDTSDARRAVEICQACPVKQPCLDTALKIEAPADVGIWGGTTAQARRRLRRERHRAAVQADSRPLVRQRPLEPLAAKTEGLHLVEDDNGDFVDRSGRVIVFEIHGDPPYMLMIDRRPRARTQTVDDAAGLAAQLLAKTAVAGEVRAGERAPSESARRLA
jgi:WhiB family transcriptional regulator, redox-sensing transcriptional regulator